MPPTISVALVTHQGRAFVDAQVASILGQRRLPDEVVVGDDASTDGTPDMVEELAASSPVPVRVHRHPTRIGITANVESALRGCSGDLIALADQDDVWPQDRLEVVAGRFRPGDPKAVFTDGHVIDAAGRRTGRRLWEELGFSPATSGSGAALFRRLLKANVVTGAAVVLDRRLLDQILPMPSDVDHDRWLALLVAARDRLEAVDRPLLEYRLHGGNAIGLAPRGAHAQRRHRRAAGDVRTRDVTLFLEALCRLEAAGDCPPDRLAALEAKLEHERFRAALPPSRLRRVVPVARHAAAGRYARFAGSAPRSVAWDLLEA